MSKKLNFDAILKYQTIKQENNKSGVHMALTISFCKDRAKKMVRLSPKEHLDIADIITLKIIRHFMP